MLSHSRSFTAQRMLDGASAAESRSLERLSSGLRINGAGDDAAGLSIASSLKAGRRIYTQALRNVSDGLSVLNVAQGALEQLQAISIRQKELAEQAASETYTLAQRKALDREANELGREFNRIIASTSFNGFRIFDTGSPALSLQAGFGSGGNISVSIGGEVARTVGDGTFRAGLTSVTDASIRGVALADFDGDDVLDVVVTDAGSNRLLVLHGNGDGTFRAHAVLEGPDDPESLGIIDFNGDGKLDIVSASGWSDSFAFLGNGDGSFQAGIFLPSSGCVPAKIAVGDVNSDGFGDVVSPGGTVYLGSNEGTFAEAGTYFFPSGQPEVLIDVNNDSRLDVLCASMGAHEFGVALGNGDGSFAASVTFTSPYGVSGITAGDFNHDGFIDTAVSHNWDGLVSIHLGNGDGSFAATSTSKVLYTGLVESGDLNGDGKLDLLTEYQVLIGNGDGSFSTGCTLEGMWLHAAIGDLNSDGAPDVAGAYAWDSRVVALLANTKEVQSIPSLNLLTRPGSLAALGTIEETSRRIQGELASIGAAMSRVASIGRVLSNTTDAYAAAESRIMDVDVAGESAEALRAKILKQSAETVLRAVNASPALVLDLLR